MLSPSHISRTIDRVEAAGFVKREPDLDDRRASQVTLTAAGREVVEQFAPRLEAIIDQIITRTLSNSEVDILVELLNRGDRSHQPDVGDGLDTVRRLAQGMNRQLTYTEIVLVVGRDSVASSQRACIFELGSSNIKSHAQIGDPRAH